MAGEDEEYEEELGIEPGDVELEEVIGEGTTATVYLARMDGNKVAVKEIRAWRDMVDHDTVMAVERELTVLSQACHPNILRFRGLIRDSEPLRLVFEYCAGGSLFELLHNCWHIELSWFQRVKMLHDSALAMDYLHSFEPAIIHRDLKSLNLMLLEPVEDSNTEPHIKLGDFGFARAKEREMTQGVGTKHWMAPEVLRTTKYTEKADVFSYAMVVFEVICRHVPFERIQPITVAKMIGSGERPDVRDHVQLDEVPPGLVEIMEACWMQDPLGRPTFKAIAADLLRMLEAVR
mmetsp:Transcript_67010/g.187331  ORF Transcript_67010/g.187331 Transcript_67010/m.187331 type:complete len:291 (+) Transcript_67010:108-980(+)|eukprot:CAMPEP_0176287860 /NCGR_PEP_ID=MMETSP0121_2-20121125/53660_1 /TAXON_ID=160619 /ORGANISM="Kryptoperidinium foliaceum, Strain CCMP 1326" /LENGTH=290 /DNA_ID=CAMNT_0017628503 /DNA_START=1 /DNA_END=873 /DNA_ORIENTATION=+